MFDDRSVGGCRRDGLTEVRLGRAITATLHRRRAPLWVRTSAVAVSAAAIFWFFFGASVMRSLRRGVTDTPEQRSPVEIEFGDSDAGEVEGWRAFYRYETVPIAIRIRGRDGAPLSRVRPRVRVFQADLQLKDAGKRREVPLEYDASEGAWRGAWIPPFGTAPGVYRVECSADTPAGAFPEDWDWGAAIRPSTTPQPKDERLHMPERPASSGASAAPPPDRLVPVVEEREFRIAAREPNPPLDGFGAVSWEILSPNLLEMKPQRPNGMEGDWRAVFDWLDLYGADMLWYSGYITSADFEPLPPGEAWFRPNVQVIDPIGEEAHRRGYLFGVYCFAYKMNGPVELLPKYDVPYYNAGVEGGLSVPSLLDDRRVNDLAAMARSLEENPNVDMIGFDYLRDAEPTFDGVDRFVEETQPPLPGDWGAKSFEQRMEWLKGHYASGIHAPDSTVARLWNWWRAHRVSQIIRDVRARSGATKPFWAYTLSALHGMEHGQDPFMFQDAGLDIDAPMLYQMPSTDLFEAFLRGNPTDSWQAYSAKGSLSLAPGNQVDHHWNQQRESNIVADPPTPLEFYRRIRVALNACRYEGEGPVGVFCHDVQRTMRSRYPDPYSGTEWAVAGAAAFTLVRTERRAIPVSLVLEAPSTADFGESFTADLHLTNVTREPVRGILPRGLSLPGLRAVETPNQPLTLAPGERATMTLTWTVTDGSDARSAARGRAGWLMAAVRVGWGSESRFPHATTFDYVRVR